METLHTLFYFVVAIGILVAIHELGHFWLARKTGVKVLRFSIGFGKVLWRRQKSPSDTEFTICAMPLGGYVKMVDEREGEVAAADLPYAFNRQPLWVRTVIVAAGPLFNLVLAILLLWAVFVVGETGFKPILGAVEPQTLAGEAGFIEGDEILSIGDNPTPTWTVAMDELMSQAVDGQRDIVVQVKSRDDSLQMRVLQVEAADIESPEQFYQHLGLKPWSPAIKPIVGQLIADGAAVQAGLQSGDLIVSADGQSIEEWQQWVEYVRARPDVTIQLQVLRQQETLNLQLTPRAEIGGDGQTVGKIGAGVEVPKDQLDSISVEYRLAPLPALREACSKTWFYSINTLKMIGKMFAGSASVKNLSGPISIAEYAGRSAEMGASAFLKFLALVSISLGVLNLLPVPVLDGGHLLFYLVEAIKGSPLSERVQMLFQQMGMVLLGLLMVLAVFLDLNRLLQ